MRNTNTKCFVCEKAIYRRPSTIKQSKKNRVYCSQKCYGIDCRKERYCIVCNKSILATENKKTCSKECFNIALKDPERSFCKGRTANKDLKYGSKSFRKKFLKERKAKCEICNYSLEKVLVIHHIKEKCNGGTDEDSNLILLCRNCHGEIHAGYRNLDGSLINKIY